MDSDNEPCVFEQRVSVVIIGRRTSPMAQLTIEIICSTICMSPSHYDIIFIPNRAGESFILFKTGPYIVQFQINDIGNCYYEMLVVNKPDPQHCTAFGHGLQSVKKHKANPVSFHVRLADSDNEPCVSPQNVSVTLTMTEIRKRVPVTVVQESASVYHVSYIPAVAGEMRVSVRVNGIPIKNSPWRVHIDNPPDPRHCVADGPRRILQGTSNSFSVHLTDSYNEPCVSLQNVSVTLRMIKTGEQIQVAVYPESASVYRVSNTPPVIPVATPFCTLLFQRTAGEMEVQVSVLVNDVHIKNSPWTIILQEKTI